MNREKGDDDSVSEDEVSEAEIAEADVLAEVDVDNVGDLSVELNVEELLAKIEPDDDDDDEEAVHKREVRRKLEELRAQKEEELDSTFNINLDDDL
jgi:hypothetical protein